MNSDQIFAAIEQIAATPGKKDKERLVGELLKDYEGKKVLVAAYDPFVTYGIAKMPARDGISGEAHRSFDNSTWKMLEKLASRELTGNAAKEALADELNALTEDSAELLSRIITKDLRAGFTDGTINRARPGTITVFDVMLAHPLKDHKHKVTYPVVVEPKLDGVRVLAFYNHYQGSVRFFSRSGKEFTSFDALKAPIIKLLSEEWHRRNDKGMKELDDAGIPGSDSDIEPCSADLSAYDEAMADRDDFEEVVLDGEVVSGSFNKTVGDVRRKDEQMTDAKFCVFDLLTKSEFEDVVKDECRMGGTYQERRERLTRIIPASGGGNVVFHLPAFEAKNEDEVHALYDKMRERGLEGVIVKDPKAFYARKRSIAWLKVKAEESVDVPVVGAFEGEGKFVGKLGGLVVKVKDVEVSVGGGFSDAQRDDLWAAYQKDALGGEQVLMGRIIEVVYHEVTPDGSLRHPRFKRFRDDKVAA